jgi:hypothetical protein
MSLRTVAVTAAFVGFYCLTVAFGPAILLSSAGGAGPHALQASLSPALAQSVQAAD